MAAFALRAPKPGSRTPTLSRPRAPATNKASLMRDEHPAVTLTGSAPAAGSSVSNQHPPAHAATVIAASLPARQAAWANPPGKIEGGSR